MKIDRVDIYAVRIPYVREIKFAYGSRSVGDYLILKIHTNEGAYGIGGGERSGRPFRGRISGVPYS